MKRTIVIISLLILIAGLSFSESENTQVSMQVGTQMNSEFQNLNMMVSFGARMHKILGLGLDTVLANDLHSWNPKGGMDLKFWLGPIYLGAGFLTPLSAVGFPEEFEDNNLLLVKTGIEVPLFWLGAGQIVLNGGVISPWHTLVDFAHDTSSFAFADHRLEASIGWRSKKY